jgi:hypothetical protein
MNEILEIIEKVIFKIVIFFLYFHIALIWAIGITALVHLIFFLAGV